MKCTNCGKTNFRKAKLFDTCILFDAGYQKELFQAYACINCGKVEIYMPKDWGEKTLAAEKEEDQIRKQEEECKKYENRLCEKIEELKEFLKDENHTLKELKEAQKELEETQKKLKDAQEEMRKIQNKLNIGKTSCISKL